MSDGDLMEGISAEAGSLAGHWRLGNLIYLYDDNRSRSTGRRRSASPRTCAKRFEAQRWHVQEIDGEDLAALDAALAAARAETERPSLVVTRTVIGRGSPVAGQSKAHGSPLGPEDVRDAKQRLGWPLERELLVPDDVRAYFAERAARSAPRARRATRSSRAGAARSPRPQRPGTPRARAACPRISTRSWPRAARRRGRDAQARRGDARADAEATPYLIGGSADLAGSNAPPILKGRGTIGDAEGGADFYAGTNIHFGVREHAMAAITNGIALDGTLRPYCGTFLIFSDYMRPSLRLAALMGVPSLFVFTHDSIYLGEDGPTHQPIEQLDALRAIPNLHVFRPADGVETAAALPGSRARRRPDAARAVAPEGAGAGARARAPHRGRRARRLRGARSGDPQVVLVARGSEVSLACDAAEKLRAERVPARVVSLPCLELFPRSRRRGGTRWSDRRAAGDRGRGRARREPARAGRLARARLRDRALRRVGALHRSRRVLRLHARPLCARVLEHLRRREARSRAGEVAPLGRVRVAAERQGRMSPRGVPSCR